MDDLLPLDDLPLEVVAAVGEASDSSAVVADEDFSDLGFFLRFLPSTAVGSSSMVVAAMAVMMMSGDDSFILMILIFFYDMHADVFAVSLLYCVADSAVNVGTLHKIDAAY